MKRCTGIALLVAVVIVGGTLTAAAQVSQTYTVEARDTLDQIAARFDVQTQCLAQANELTDPGALKVGQTLIIDLNCPLYDGVDFVTNPRSTSGSSLAGSSTGGQGGGVAPSGYTVVRGDTLDTIGQSLNVSVMAIRVANELTESVVIFPGQNLVIPTDAPPYGQFPALADPLNPGAVVEGQGGGGPARRPGDQVYVVQPRDVLDLISAQFDAQDRCIAEANALADAGLIYPGQELVIPSDCPRYDGEAFVTSPRA